MTHRVHLPLILNQPPRLKDLFGNHGIQFGFGVGVNSFVDAPWNEARRRLIVQHANIVTTGNALKMEFTQPEQGVWDFSEGDAIVAAAHELGIDVHGHTASWHMQNPEWLVKEGFDKHQLAIILWEHVVALGWHFDGKIISLDTANEAYIKPDGGVYGGVWQPLGDGYVRLSFEGALDAINCLVMYNSFYPHPEHEYDKALDVLDKGWCDGIGIQLHLWDGSYQQTLAHTDAFLSRIRAVGGWCRFSEISVLAGSDWAQAIVYAAITELAIKYKDVVKGFIVWDVKDPGWRGDVTLFDRDGKPKAAYHAIVEELRK